MKTQNKFKNTSKKEYKKKRSETFILIIFNILYDAATTMTTLLYFIFSQVCFVKKLVTNTVSYLPIQSLAVSE